MATIAWWRQTVRLASDQQDAQTHQKDYDGPEITYGCSS
jgi:hypothetical protein